MIRFGPMSIVLLCGALYGALRAAMLCFAPVNRTANRLLAALLLVLALFTAPYVIGYAGYYDAYPWLSFAPYNLTLAVGPLLYLYVACMLNGGARLPRRWALHLLPALAQLLYYSALFVRPLAFKNAWNAGAHLPYVDPVESVAMLVSMALYWSAACRLYLRGAAPRLEWIRNLLVALGLTILFWVILKGADHAGQGLSYFQRFPFYMWLAIVIGYLGTEGYRHGMVAATLATPSKQADPAPAIDQAAIGQRWQAAIVAGQWWRDPELSLASLARLLGTNNSALSRALNEALVSISMKRSTACGSTRSLRRCANAPTPGPCSTSPWLKVLIQKPVSIAPLNSIRATPPAPTARASNKSRIKQVSDPVFLGQAAILRRRPAAFCLDSGLSSLTKGPPCAPAFSNGFFAFSPPCLAGRPPRKRP